MVSVRNKYSKEIFLVRVCQGLGVPFNYIDVQLALNVETIFSCLICLEVSSGRTTAPRLPHNCTTAHSSLWCGFAELVVTYISGNEKHPNTPGSEANSRECGAMNYWDKRAIRYEMEKDISR